MNKSIFFDQCLVENKFIAMAIDQGTSLKNLIKNKIGIKFQDNDYYIFKNEIINTLSPYLSSYLVDYDTYVNFKKENSINMNPIIAFEEDAYFINDDYRITNLPTNFDMKTAVKEKFPAIKFFMYFNPETEKNVNTKKMDLIKFVGEKCDNHNISFLFEPLLYEDKIINISTEKYNFNKPNYIEYFYNEFSKSEYNIDIIKIEFPFNPKEVENFSNTNESIIYSESDILKILIKIFGNYKKPYVFLSAGISFINFLKGLELINKSGINYLGFLCGRAIWNDAIDVYCHNGKESLIKWLNSEGTKRVKLLKKTVLN